MISFGPNFFFPDSYMAPQFSPAEEARQAAEEREQELRADFPLYDLEPDFDPFEEDAA